MKLPLPFIRHVMRNLLLSCWAVFVSAVSLADEVDVPSEKPLAEHSQLLRLVIDEFPPYTMKDSERPGFVVELVVETYKLAGYEVDVVFIPWKRALLMVQENKFDGVLSAYATEQRKAYLNFSKAGLETNVLIAKLKSTRVQFDALESLKPYKIGVLKGSAHFEGEFYDATYLDKEIIEGNEQGIKLLLSGRVDMLVSQKMILDYAISKDFSQFKDQIEYLPRSIVKKESHTAISRHRADHQQILDRFDQAFKRLKASGEYRRILQSYGISD